MRRGGHSQKLSTNRQRLRAAAGVYSEGTAGAYDAHPTLRFVEFDHFLITDI